MRLIGAEKSATMAYDKMYELALVAAKTAAAAACACECYDQENACAWTAADAERLPALKAAATAALAIAAADAKAAYHAILAAETRWLPGPRGGL